MFWSRLNWAVISWVYCAEEPVALNLSVYPFACSFVHSFIFFNQQILADPDSVPGTVVMVDTGGNTKGPIPCFYGTWFSGEDKHILKS